MSDAVIVAIISGAVSFVVGIASALIAAKSTGNDVQKKMEIAQAVTDTRLEELTREVRSHNEFGKRIPTLEADVSSIKEDVKELRNEQRSLMQKYVDGYSHK